MEKARSHTFAKRDVVIRWLNSLPTALNNLERWDSFVQHLVFPIQPVDLRPMTVPSPKKSQWRGSEIKDPLNGWENTANGLNEVNCQERAKTSQSYSRVTQKTTSSFKSPRASTAGVVPQCAFKKKGITDQQRARWSARTLLAQSQISEIRM